MIINININKHLIGKLKTLEGRLMTMMMIIFHKKHSTFVGSAWSFVFFIPATTANDLRLRRISIPDFIHYIFSYLNSSARASISLFNVECQTRALLVPFLYFCYDAVLDWGLNLGLPTFKASTLPLGYRGGVVLTRLARRDGSD